MRTYTGNPRTLAVDVTGDNVKAQPLEPRLDTVRHSDTGFAWGYHGSGPTQLAFALIADALLLEAGDDKAKREHALLRASNPILYSQFKARVVGLWPRDGSFEITSAEVLEWVRKIESEMPPGLKAPELKS